MLKKPSVLYVVIAVVALSVGLLVYLLDRQPEHTYFLSHALTLATAPYAVFGVAGNYLPAFLHVYAFILLTVAVAGSTRARLIGICTAWLVIASLFEFAQHPALSPFLAAALPAWFARVPVLDNTASYFLNGTFDVLDLLAIALGTAAAYLTVTVTHKAHRADFKKGQNRVLRRGAITGVTVLGLLAIIASGDGGGGTPDTTPPTIIATAPVNGATGFFVDGSIRITFSEPMDPATVNPTTFKLEDANGTSVISSVFYNSDVVTITPAFPQPLAPHAVYTATVTSDVKDLAGNALTAAHSWSFTTEIDAWLPTSLTSAPTGRSKHTAVWAGSEMIVWGGQISSGASNSGGRYNPATDTWVTTTLTNVPTPRLDHTAIWTGTKMIVWGGWDGGSTYFNNGAAYDPVNGWSSIALPPSFSARRNHTAVWTGTRMIVWGGWDGFSYFNNGAAYDPVNDVWSSIATPFGFSGRRDHTAVWTGTEMIVMGGFTDLLDFTNTSAAYNPATDTWRPIADPPAGFLGRSNHTGVWTGTEIIIWGGDTNAGVTNTGAAYNPATDTWRVISTTGAPTPRLNHTAVWTGPMGIAMVVWGGQDGPFSFRKDGGRYDPVTDSWRTTDDLTSNVPTNRYDHTAVWTGTTMIVWGGYDGTFTNAGGRYAP